jgi:OmpA-OmpF porin, OOP family
MGRKRMRALGTALLMWSASAAAIHIDGYEGVYGWGGGLYEFGDSKRDSDDGLGFQLGIGMPFLDRSGESLEFSFRNLEREREVDGRNDYQRTIFANWTRDLGLSELPLAARPFVLVGAGAVQEDVAGDDHLHFGVDGGLGALFPLLNWGWAVRAEAVAQAQLNDKSVPDEDYLLDFQLRLGLQIPFDYEAAAPAVAPAEECPTRVVDPVSGRSDCISDSDRDGVADADDQCPGTPAGQAVDAKGCTIGGPVDSDGDGVLDQVDACPGSTAGMTVDATGCIVEQTVTLRAVNFETSSARLMSDSRIALEEVARTLKNQKNLKAEVVGHTDDVGNDGYNLTLSQQRAESVRQYLIGKGVDADRLVAIGLGETQPIAGNDSEEGRVANRRVEFKVSVQ